ncbi:MAG: Rid family hydrolase [Metamycoplasmataceae bacterium]
MNKLNAVLARNVKNAPVSVCDFSHTVAFSHYNHLSAQLPIDVTTNKLVSGGIKEQATQCFKNIEAVIKGINHVMDDVVRLTIITKSVNDVEPVKEVLKTFFKSYLPTSTTIIVKNIPMNALVQIEAVITCGEGTIPNAPQAGDLIKVVKNTDKVPKCCTQTQSVAFSHYNNLSAQLPVDPKTNEIVKGGISEQLNQCLRNIKTILESIDVPFDDIVKVNIFVKNIKDREIIKQEYKKFFPDSAIARAVNYFPALSVIEVADIVRGALVQVEVVVSHGDGTPPQAVEDRHGIVIYANNTPKAPQKCHSTQTVAFSHYNNISMQLPIDAKTNELVSDDFEKQTTKCLENIKTILESIDHKMEDVVKLNIFVKDIKNIDLVSKTLKKFFPKTLPAGRIVEVSNIEKNALVQIDAVVSNAEGTPPKLKFCNG